MVGNVMVGDIMVGDIVVGDIVVGDTLNKNCYHYLIFISRLSTEIIIIIIIVVVVVGKYLEVRTQCLKPSYGFLSCIFLSTE
jgi:hypothetical protein